MLVERGDETLLSIIGFLCDIIIVLLYGIIGTMVPKNIKPKIKHIANHILAIEDTSTPENRCYAVQVFDFPSEKSSHNTTASHFVKPD